MDVDRGLRIDLLGQPRFFYNGEPFAFHSRPRALPLLVFLLLHRGAHLTRDFVAFSLWPDDSETDARGKLRRYLHHVTSALPPCAVPYIASKDDSIRWNDEAGVRVDVDEFERCAGDDTRWHEIVELYRGDLAPAVYDEWISPVRERLRRKYIAVVERLLLRARSRREFTTALSYGERILATDRWREDTLRQIASIRYESGDRAGALREIDVFAERLADEMGVELMPETLALRALMLRGGALPDAVQESIDTPVPGNALPFVGRVEELETLGEAWRRAAQGSGKAVLIGGEAGIGKTRLANELALLVNTQGGRVLRGTTSSPEQLPYQPIVEALRDALPLLVAIEVRPIWLAAVAALVPELTLRRSDVPELPPIDPARERARLLEGLAAVIGGLARQRPLLIVLEDLQWAGEATLSSFEYLARRVAALPALIVGTYRNQGDDVVRALQPLRRKLQLENVADHLSLGGLSSGEVCELARSLPPLAADAGAIGAHVHAVSGGNPLFAGELLRESAESGIREASSRFLQAMIEVRTSRASENARTIGEVASVLGATFDVHLLCETSGVPEDAVLDGLRELLGRNLVREVGKVHFAFTFAHQLIAAAIYESVEAVRRAQWHRRAAVAIERLASDREEAAGTLAYHYDRGGEPEKASAYYLASAKRSFALFANQDALTSATRGLEQTHDTQRRRDLLGLRERILARLGDLQAQRADIDALERLALDDDARTDILWRRAQWARAVGELTDEARFLDDFAERVRAAGDRPRQAAAYRAAARNLMARSHYADAVAQAEAALQIDVAEGHIPGQIDELCLLSEISVNQGDASRAEKTLEDARLRAQSSGDPVLIARVAMAGAAVAINRRDFARALTDSREAQSRFREIGDRAGEAEAGARVAAALSFQMRFEEAGAEFEAAANIYRALGNRLQLAYLLFNQTGGQMQLGLVGDAQDSLTSALEIFETFEDVRGRVACLANLSMVRLLQQEPHEAKEIGMRALQISREISNSVIEAAALANLGNAERELGELDSALAHMKEALAIRERLGRSATFEELGDFALAQLKAREPDAVRTADDIMDRADASGENTVWPHYCFWAAARVYHERGEPAKAAAALEKAQAHVRAQLEAMSDERSRRAFGNLKDVRAIAAAASDGIWP
ncbi:MAG TPA: AAA family ATPase [Candidatus Baltobacteraceae bacterium]|jgi:DNA-binding SARP family transcriptional activator/tetratricopeptide (TPR) repeat protein|nr:AAA family ATPase [Candidatus Baltobacteraceae bacterium]